MRVAVIGSRTASCADTFNAILDFQSRVGRITHLVSGGAEGADTFAALSAWAYEVPVTTHYPDWDAHGKSAGFRRNIKIVNDCEHVIALWDYESKGTKHSLDIAERSFVPVVCYRIPVMKKKSNPVYKKFLEAADTFVSLYSKDQPITAQQRATYDLAHRAAVQAASQEPDTSVAQLLTMGIITRNRVLVDAIRGYDRTHTHPYGNRTLTEVAQRLTSHFDGETLRIGWEAGVIENFPGATENGQGGFEYVGPWVASLSSFVAGARESGQLTIENLRTGFLLFYRQPQ